MRCLSENLGGHERNFTGNLRLTRETRVSLGGRGDFWEPPDGRTISLGLQRDLGAVLAGQSGLNRNGLRLSRNPSIKRKAAAAKPAPAPTTDPRRGNPPEKISEVTARKVGGGGGGGGRGDRRWRDGRTRGAGGAERRTPLPAAGRPRARTASLSAAAGKGEEGAARGRKRKTDRWEGEERG